jgi:hypothetical protein
LPLSTFHIHEEEYVEIGEKYRVEREKARRTRASDGSSMTGA